MNIIDQIVNAATQMGQNAGNYISGIGKNVQAMSTGGPNAKGTNPAPAPQQSGSSASAGNPQVITPGAPLPLIVGGSGVFGTGSGVFGSRDLNQTGAGKAGGTAGGPGGAPTPGAAATGTVDPSNPTDSASGILQRIIRATSPDTLAPGGSLDPGMYIGQ